MKISKRILFLKIIMGTIAIISLVILIWSQLQYINLGISLKYEIEEFGKEIETSPRLKFREGELKYLMNSFLLVGAYSLVVFTSSILLILIKWRENVKAPSINVNTTRKQ